MRSACRVRRACSRAARHSPRRGTSRVFTRPGRAARENTSTATSRFVESRKPLGCYAKVVKQPQAPHEDDGAQHAALLPAPARGAYPFSHAARGPPAAHLAAEGDVLHQCDRRESGKRVAAHENRLVARGDARKARAEIHRPGDHLEKPLAAVDLDIETPPHMLLQG